MRVQLKFLKVVLEVLGSSKLALMLVFLVILFSLVGVLLPQEGNVDIDKINRWQKDHSFLSALTRPLGLFHVFHSLPFVITILLLGINTVSCTVFHFFREGGFSFFKGPLAIKNAGFIILHSSLILLFVGGFWSSALRMDGYIVLTEGQNFIEAHNSYLRLLEGPLRQEHHKRFSVRLEKVQTEFDNNGYLLDIASHLEFSENEKEAILRTIKVNKPLTYKGLIFTQDKTGFSPRLLIWEKNSKKPLADSFVALKTFQKGKTREYQDFLAMPIFEQKVTLTFFPDYRKTDTRIEKIGEKPKKPLLEVKIEDDNGTIAEQGYIPLNGRVHLNDFIFGFSDLRRWASFRVMEDPAYPLIWIALWLGVGGILLRYFPDLRKLFHFSGKSASVRENNLE